MKLTELFIIKEMTFDEAWATKDINPDEARREVDKHGASWEDFLAEVGEKPVYTGAEVLGWLGY